MLIDIQKMLTYDEGYRLTVYRCTKGFLTGGIGHNFDADPALKIMHRKVKFGDKLSPDECLALFDYDIKKVMMGLKTSLPFFDSAPENIRAVLINMAFQMGVHGVLGFGDMIDAMAIGDYEKAAIEIEDSKYYKKDTPNRARRVMWMCVGSIDKHYLACQV